MQPTHQQLPTAAPCRMSLLRSKFESPVLNGALLGALLQSQRLYGCTFWGCLIALSAACFDVSAHRCVTEQQSQRLQHGLPTDARIVLLCLFLAPCVLFMGYYAAGYTIAVRYTLTAVSFAVNLLLAAGARNPTGGMLSIARSSTVPSIPGTRYFGVAAAVGYVLLLCS
jgi:hypothetical protein